MALRQGALTAMTITKRINTTRLYRLQSDVIYILLHDRFFLYRLALYIAALCVLQSEGGALVKCPIQFSTNQNLRILLFVCRQNLLNGVPKKLCMVLDLCSMLCIFTAVNLTLTCKCQREECRIGAWSSRECCSPLRSSLLVQARTPKSEES